MSRADRRSVDRPRLARLAIRPPRRAPLALPMPRPSRSHHHPFRSVQSAPNARRQGSTTTTRPLTPKATRAPLPSAPAGSPPPAPRPTPPPSTAPPRCQRHPGGSSAAPAPPLAAGAVRGWLRLVACVGRSCCTPEVKDFLPHALRSHFAESFGFLNADGLASEILRRAQCGARPCEGVHDQFGSGGADGPGGER